MRQWAVDMSVHPPNGGRPSNQFVGEGHMAVFNKKKMFSDPLDPLIKAEGVTDENWVTIVESLKSTWGMISKKAFKAKIEEFNEYIKIAF